MQHLKVGLKILNALSFQLYCGGARITGVLGETTHLPKEPYKHYHIKLQSTPCHSMTSNSQRQ